MDNGPLRALVLASNLAAHGVPITVIRPAPDDDPITTRGIWLTWDTESQQAGMDFQRREQRTVMGLRRLDVPTVPRGTVILAPPKGGDTVQGWRVDGTDMVFADHVRVIVIAAPDLDA